MPSVSETDFAFDRYKKPVMLNKRESLVQVLLNALFMVPGNMPSIPDAGVDIRSYLYKFDTSIDSDQLMTKIKYTCGETIMGIALTGISLESTTLNGEQVLMILFDLIIDGEEDSLVLLLQQSGDVVKFNYSYMNETLKSI